MKYRKKPVVIEAHRWFKNGDHPEDRVITVGSHNGEPIFSEGKIVRLFRHPNISGSVRCNHCKIIMHHHGWIETLEGEHIVCPGDFIIKGVKGEFYPCKPDIFEMSYEVASE